MVASRTVRPESRGLICRSGKEWRQPSVGIFDQLRQDFRFAYRRHEVGVAEPAGHDMKVDVICDACPRGLSLVDADIDALGSHCVAKDGDGLPGDRHKVGRDGDGQISDGRNVVVWDHHEMSRIVRIGVEDDVDRFGAEQNSVVFVPLLLGLYAEDASRVSFGLSNVLHPPGGPHVLQLMVLIDFAVGIQSRSTLLGQIHTSCPCCARSWRRHMA